MLKLSPDCFITEFDSQRRILHVAYRNRIHPTSKEHLDIIFEAFSDMLEEFTALGKIYLIIDMTNFIVEPDLKSFYIANARKLLETYVIPHGIARYGFQITRITVRAGYHQYMNDNPNIFNSRDEAFEYINSVIKKNQEVPQTPAAVMTNGDREGR
jgi:FMN-dependent NADH-azoreductase